MIKIFLKSVASLILCPIIAGIYGMLHDQITFTISAEYFLYFKALRKTTLPHRLAASIIGWNGTWWLGLFAAIILVLLYLIKRNTDHLIKNVVSNALWIICISAAAGIVGGVVGFIFPTQSGEFFDFAMRHNVEYYTAYFSVWMIHWGGYIGSVVGIVYFCLRIVLKKIN